MLERDLAPCCSELGAARTHEMAGGTSCGVHRCARFLEIFEAFNALCPSLTPQALNPCTLTSYVPCLWGTDVRAGCVQGGSCHSPP